MNKSNTKCDSCGNINCVCQAEPIKQVHAHDQCSYEINGVQCEYPGTAKRWTPEGTHPICPVHEYGLMHNNSEKFMKWVVWQSQKKVKLYDYGRAELEFALWENGRKQ